MWFKQTDPKSPQQAEPAEARPQAPPAAAPTVPASVPAAAAEPPRASAVSPAALPISAQASRITPGIAVKGEISGSEELWIGGTVEGELRFAGARITVGNSGTVRGQLDAREIVLEGRVEGNLRATDRVAIAPTGQVRGDASAPRVAIDDGAVFNGSIQVIREGEARAASPSAPIAHSSRSSGRPAKAASSHTASAAAASAGPSAPPAGIAAGAAADSSSDTLSVPRSVLTGPPAADPE